jgi:hypothetical protein
MNAVMNEADADLTRHFGNRHQRRAAARKS